MCCQLTLPLLFTLYNAAGIIDMITLLLPHDTKSFVGQIVDELLISELSHH
jgi:hypothetical protein